MKQRRRAASRLRRGLAPLEMVLAIPLLLFVVGLSVIFGVVTCWKVRAEVTARDAVWSGRWPRWGTGVPRPLEWPQPGSYGWRHEAPLASLDHMAFRHPVIRGPLPSNLAVNTDLFDPTLGPRVGEAETTRTPPALAALGTYTLDVEQPILDGKWQHGQMGLSNTSRRIPVIYPNLQSPSQTAGLRAQYQQAIQAVVGNPGRPDLEVLDRDQEIFAWYRFYHDFHPRFGQFCSLDAEEVRQSDLPRHIERIDGTPPPGRRPRRPFGVPTDLTRFFLSMYRAQLAVLQNSVPPGDPAEIAELMQKIEILEDFLEYLTNLP